MLEIDAILGNPVYFLISGVFGGLALLIFIAIAGIYYFHKKKSKKLKDMNPSNQDFRISQGVEVNKKSEHDSD